VASSDLEVSLWGMAQLLKNLIAYYRAVGQAFKSTPSPPSNNPEKSNVVQSTLKKGAFSLEISTFNCRNIFA
jgi:hypothetical protein